MGDVIKEFLELRDRQPRAALYQVVNFNSDYTNYTDGLKNCYLLTNAFNSEDCFFGRNLSYNRDCIDCDHCHGCELCYQCVDCIGCYNGNFLQDCEQCTDCTFGYDLRGCRDCFGCMSLRQKQYYIFNQPYSKELYFEKIHEFQVLIQRGEVQELQAQFEQLKNLLPHRAAHLLQSENVAGDYIVNSKNCFYSFDIKDSQDLGYCYEVKKSTDCFDIAVGEFMVGNYECHSAWKLQNSTYCNNCWESSDLEYCDQVFRSNHCFFCVYLNHKEYHILNKPYSKDEYFKQVAACKEQLKAAELYGRWFIPWAYPIQDTCAIMARM